MKTTTQIAIASLSIFAGAAFSVGPEHKKDSTEQQTKDMASPQTLQDIVGKVDAPELFVGSKAPELKLAHFVKGDSVNEFESGHVYVVEFWATWCGPCIAAFPHLSELQETHQDNATFIGVNVLERDPDQATRIDRISQFVIDQGESMEYTVAIESNKDMETQWLKPAQQNGIPTAFIVDGTGTVAWIGHPMTMDEHLQSIIDGDFDIESARNDALDRMVIDEAFMRFAQAMQTGANIEDARSIAKILIRNQLNEEPMGLNQVAWMMLSAQSHKVGMEDYKIALAAAKTACELSEWNNWMILDTYAKAAHMTGNHAEAVKWQTKAIELIPEQYMSEKPQLEAALKTYKASEG